MIERSKIRRLSGFGRSSWADGYVFKPENQDEIQDVFDIAADAQRKVVLRGAGKSYGDANYAAEQVILDLTAMNRFLSYDRHSHILEVEGGASLESIWKHTLTQGGWLPVVSGTAKPTVAGALAMNIHGKNAFNRGTLGEHVLEIDLQTPHRVQTLTPIDDLFSIAISGAGLSGVITRVKLQMKPVTTAMVRVYAVSCQNWSEQFLAFERFEGDAEYVVSWIDGFSHGRGLLHAGWHSNKGTLLMDSEATRLPLWVALRLFNNGPGMRLINTIKHYAGRFNEHNHTHEQTLAQFNFLLDAVPGWERAYDPDGLIQCQFFIAKEHARLAFPKIVSRAQALGFPPYLCVMKRHRLDSLPFVFSHAVDGYSLALDFKVTERNRGELWAMADELNRYCLSLGGKFYLAKDSTLTETTFKDSLAPGALERFANARHPLFTSALAQRLNI